MRNTLVVLLFFLSSYLIYHGIKMDKLSNEFIESTMIYFELAYEGLLALGIAIIVSVAMLAMGFRWKGTYILLVVEVIFYFTYDQYGY